MHVYRNWFFVKGGFYLSLLTLLFAISPNALAQHYFTRNFTVEDGLPSNIVRAVFKDSRKIMWIGTGAGLCRFNGRDFTVYNSANGLAAENIFDITEDNEGNLWIGAMAQGISKFDGKSFTNFTTKEGLVCNDVRRVWWSKKFNILLVGTNRGVSVYDGKRFYSMAPEEVHSLTDTWYVLGFLEQSDHIECYAYSNDKICRYYPDGHRLVLSDSTAISDGGPSCSVVVRANGDTISGWSRAGVKVWNKGLKASFDSLGQVFHMALGDEQNVWIAAWAENPATSEMPGGLYLYNGNSVERLSERTGITDSKVWTVYYDTVFQILWVGTLHQGLFRFPSPCFEWYHPEWFGLTSMQIKDLYPDQNNNLWIATTRGLIRKNADKGFIQIPQQEIRLAQYQSMKRYLPLRYGFLKDRDGSYEKYEELIRNNNYHFPNPYRGDATDAGAKRHTSPGKCYNPAGFEKEVNRWRASLHDTAAIFFHSIGGDSRGNIYAYGGDGLNRFNDGDPLSKPEMMPLHGIAWVFAFDEADTLFYSSYWDRGIWHCAIFPEWKYPHHPFYSANDVPAPAYPIRMISRGNEIWSASRNGGLYLTQDGKNYNFCELDTTLPRSINDICFDGPQNIIAGANNGEVLIFSFTENRLKLLFRLNGKDGIVGNSVQWLQAADKEHRLYIGTNAGLNIADLNMLYSTGRASVRFFSKEAGFMNLKGNKAVIDQAGFLWIAAGDVLGRVELKQLEKRKIHQAKLILTGMEINYQSVDNFPGIKVDPWFHAPEGPCRLAHDQDNLVFYFDALNYLDAGQQRFRYRLMPSISRWCDYSVERKAAFTNLYPGNYRLEIESVNLLDQTRYSFLSYEFVIMPPFYFTWWFFLVLSVIVVIGVTIIWRYRTKQIRKEEKRKADIRLELNNIEMKALKAQMNPHFIFNAINSIQSYILSNNVDRALYYLSMFAKLVRKTLENASRESIPLCEELEYLSFYIDLEKMRFEGQFESELDLDPKVPLDTTMIAPMIVQPFVENAIKHGLLKTDRVGKLKLQVKRLSETRFQVIVEDNGVGRDRAEELRKKSSKEHHSKGMSITNTRIHLLNENERTGAYNIKIIDLFDASNHPAGTRVELTFPLD